jgi:hypothetical protein
MPDAPAHITKPQHLRRRETQSPTSSYSNTIDISTIPPAVARDPRRKTAWLKARAQFARNRALRYDIPGEAADLPEDPMNFPMDIPMDSETEAEEEAALFADIGPKRKQCAFVREEEMKWFREDRAGTPHISELQADDDVIAPLSVEELSMGGEVEALARIRHEQEFVGTYGQ